MIVAKPAASHGGTTHAIRRGPNDGHEEADRGNIHVAIGPSLRQTWTSPIVGTSVPKYQNQPTAKDGGRRMSPSAATVTAIKTATTPRPAPAADESHRDRTRPD